jgi:hypothetical protein
MFLRLPGRHSLLRRKTRELHSRTSQEEKEMSAPTPCLRHSEHKWLAYCSDCTTWHLARLLAARENAARNNAARDNTAHADRRRLTLAA